MLRSVRFVRIGRSIPWINIDPKPAGRYGNPNFINLRSKEILMTGFRFFIISGVNIISVKREAMRLLMNTASITHLK